MRHFGCVPRVGEHFVDLTKLSPGDLAGLTDEQLRQAGENLFRLDAQDRREMQLLRYVPASPRAQAVHASKARLVGIGGGNGSGKSETAIIRPLALATGVIPRSQWEHFRPQFRGPINVRFVIQSLKHVLKQTFLPKLQWWKWTGMLPPGGMQGHWGWIPKFCLKDGSWDRSWSSQSDTLTILCRNPDNLDEILGESLIHIMSHEQSSADAASGDFHEIVLDEPPKLGMFRESQARTMRVNGRITLAMTWPDDPSIAVDWIYDELYEPGQPGPNKNPDVDWFELWTEENSNLNQESVAHQAAKWSQETRNVRLFGRPIRFSNRIHPLFTDIEQTWSLAADQPVMPLGGVCPITGSSDLVPYNHVQEFEPNPRWPTVFALDPHPRKPHMFVWAQVDPNDDIWVSLEGEEDMEPVGLREQILATEKNFAFNVARRLIDPNMGASPASTDRETTWQSALTAAGLDCDLADDSDIGRKLINEYLKVDRRTRKPRLIVHPRCTKLIYQVKRYVWDNYKRQDERGEKEKPRDKYDDYPTILKYILNSQPTFRALMQGNVAVRNLAAPFKPPPTIRPRARGDHIYKDDRP